ncbi:MAG: hypothetical protein MUO52_04365, partial [Desulfobacterales bacterium]|nr:hypothetical protein [Desulfobacterales bacterium]
RPLLYPVQLEIDNEDASFTRLKVTSEDTPTFLYALSTALSLHDISIEHVRIRTIRGRVEDQLDLVDSHGRKILDPHLLGRVRLSVLLTKQFTTFLGRAPDPLAALSRFEHLLEEMLRKPAKEDWLELLTNPHALQDLARLLGASDFLWEDFIRVQYESLLPMLQPYVSGRRLAEPIETLPERMEQTLKGARSPGDREKRLNEFKDREIFLIDLDHILNPGADLQALSRGLTSLAEAVLNRASSFVYEDLVRRFGPPRTVAGLDARYAVLGLGKLGGAALGYASDIELLLVYSDSGSTEGRRPIANSEFFDRLVKGVVRFIRAKREGIFHVDLRLRPYGNAGPLACSLESFCRYYAPDGQAHAYERLALVCLRAIGGDPDLGSRVERLRDEMIYFGGPLDLRELLDLRERQFKEKTEGGKLNAKFSPGGLVDIEYGVQILQVTCGKDFPQLRTPHINEALAALHGGGVLSEEETRRLSEAYRFLRHLINGMRMLRGSARDLFLPSVESHEFAHLARRMGYQRGGPLDPQEQLRIDFEKHTATARAFIERHFGRDSLPGPGVGTVADLILGDRLPRDMTREILVH